jgi:hypothetical protein
MNRPLLVGDLRQNKEALFSKKVTAFFLPDSTPTILLQ